MNALITGASGFIGGYVIRALLGKGASVTALTRNAKRLEDQGAEVVESLDAIPNDAKFDLIINLAGASISKRWTPKYTTEILDSRIGTTKALHNLVKRLKKKPKTIISASAIGYYGDQGNAWLKEYSEPRSGFTHDLCAAWEKEAQRMEKLGPRVFIIRLGVVLGKGQGMLKQVVPPFKMGLGGRIGTGKQHFSWVHIKDVIRGMFFLAESRKRGGIYNLTSPNPVTNAEWTRALASVLRRPALLSMPESMVKLLFGEMGESLLLGSQRVLPQRLTDEGFKFQYPSLNKALRDIFSH